MNENSKAVSNVFVMMTVKWAIIFGVTYAIRKSMEKSE